MDEINPAICRSRRCPCHRRQRRHQSRGAHDKASPIYGMPILDVDKAHNVIVIKRSMNPGFAGIDNGRSSNPENPNALRRRQEIHRQPNIGRQRVVNPADVFAGMDLGGVGRDRAYRRRDLRARRASSARSDSCFKPSRDVVVSRAVEPNRKDNGVTTSRRDPKHLINSKHSRPSNRRTTSPNGLGCRRRTHDEMDV